MCLNSAVEAVANARENARATTYSVESKNAIESKLATAVEVITTIGAGDNVTGLLFKISSLSHEQVR